MATKTENRREFLQLAHVLDPAKHSIAGWFLSEKYDGQRAYWDGGVTRGLYCHEVPFANTAKDGIRVNPPKATGLWSRYGKAVQAPAWWLDEMPKFPLDGELYMGRGRFQELMSTVRRIEPVDDDWALVNYCAFDLPDYGDVFRDGNLSSPNFTKSFVGVVDWLRTQKICKWEPKRRRFETVVFLLNREFGGGEHPIVRSVPQEQLPFKTKEAFDRIWARLEEVVAGGGEGLMLRNLNTVWEPQRSWNVLKVKPFTDCEVKVRGYVWGRETDKGSKLLGLMGAMVTDFHGKRLELSGFTDEERTMTSFDPDGQYDRPVRLKLALQEGAVNPGKEVDVTRFTNLRFPIGSTVTIRYRELTRDQLPKEARYWRERPDGE
jgi:DNA ligase-1